MKKQHFIIKCQVYPYEIMVLMGYDFDEITSVLSAYVPEDIESEISLINTDSVGATAMLSNGITLMRLDAEIKPEKLNGIIVHECFHAVKFILDELGMKLTNESEEAYSYLLQ